MSKPTLHSIAKRMGKELDAIEWKTPSHVYNPLQYAWSAYETYLERYGSAAGRALLLGMNPGPWGMAQTGVPFGNISAVRDWFGIETRLARHLPEQHPKYPILGMACHRDEGSGQRVWGWARERYATPERFFRHFFIWNYCPLLFLAKDHNMIPSALKRDEREALDAVCTHALRQVLDVLQPAAVVGIGRYAETKLHAVLGAEAPVVYLPHPSPAHPAANRDWPALADAALGPWMGRAAR